jgi:hypothetical protein
VEDIEASSKFFNDTIQYAGWNATLEHKRTFTAYDCHITIKQKFEEKRLRREWHRLRTPASKRLLNAATQELKELNNNKNECVQPFLQGITPRKSTDYSLWKATTKLKRVKNFLRHWEHHKELGREAMSKKHTLSLNTWEMFFSRISQKTNPKRKKR